MDAIEPTVVMRSTSTNHWWQRIVAPCLTTLVIAAIAVVSPVQAAPQPGLTYQGRILDSLGVPITDGPYLVRFSLYSTSVGSTDLWSSGFLELTVVDGLLVHQLGDSVSLDPAIWSTTDSLWLGVKIGTDPELTPRQKLTSPPYSALAGRADSAGFALRADSARWVDSSAFAARADSASTADLLDGKESAFYLQWSNLIGIPADFADGVDNDSRNADSLDGQSPDFYRDWQNLIGVPSDFADGVDDTGAGDITSVLVGPGLAGGALAGDATISVAELGITNTELADNAVANRNLQGNSVTAVKMFDEPGVAQSLSGVNYSSPPGPVNIPDGAGPVALDSLTLNLPGNGFVELTFSVTLRVTASSNVYVILFPSPDGSNAFGSGGANSLTVTDSRPSTYFQTFHYSLLVAAGIGAQTYYVVGNNIGSDLVQVQNMAFIARFYPTAYGTVTNP